VSPLLLLGAWLAQAAPPIPAPLAAPGAALPRLTLELDAAALRAAFADDPPIDRLRRAASALAGADPERARSFVERARWAALLPEVRVRVDRRFGRTESLDLGGSAQEAVASPVGVDTINDLRYDCRATWDLGRIVFNPDELGAESEALRMADVRREIEAQVIRLYFERRRLKAEALTTDSSDKASRFRLDLRAQEIEAELDALTGGAFTRLRSTRRGEPSRGSPPE
jgi:hypothetical protein